VRPRGQRRSANPARRAPADRGAAGRQAGTLELSDPLGRGRRSRHRGERPPDLGRRDLRGDGDLLAPGGRRGCGRRAMKVKVWGARGSVPAPGPEMNRYGGNTSCVQVTLSDGETLILDAGTG